MNKEIKMSVAGFIFIATAGTLLHFLYSTFPSAFTAAVSPINESTWEHLKLLFFPSLLWAVAEYFTYGKNNCAFLPSRFLAICAAMLTVVVLFYTYTGVSGKDIAALDISIFFVAVAVYSYLSFYLQKSEALATGNAVSFAIIGFFLLFIAFVLFTVRPPDYPLFTPPSA